MNRQIRLIFLITTKVITLEIIISVNETEIYEHAVFKKIRFKD